MSAISQNTAPIDAVRADSIACVDKLVEKARTFELPSPPEGLEAYRRKLLDNTYQVLVVGEAKRGKSTFVNALMGADILPTDVDVATSQVFCIRQAEREAYRLRFEDDSAREIRLEDLPRFGSQVVADAEGTPRLDQVIRWIEVEGPIRLLPPGVSVLDTPGMGALYAAHAQITQRFVPLADAVLFVLDSQRPISQEELQFLENLLGVTRSIFFIQTKIDLFRKEDWQKVQARNQEILRERFADRLDDLRVWPISSTNLRKAAATGDEDYVMVSRHRELAAALQAFLFRVAGWGRAAAALLLADQYYAGSGRTLANRYRALIEESRHRQAEFQQQAAQRKQQFEADWGERGEKYRELMEGIRRTGMLGKTRMNQLLRPGGEIPAAMQARIDVAATLGLEAARAVGGRLADQFGAATLEAWRQVRDKAGHQYAELLAPFYADTETLLGQQETGDPGPLTVSVACPELQVDWFSRWRGTLMAGVGVSSGIGLLHTLGFISAAAAAAPAVSVVAPIAAFLFYMGWKTGGDAQMKGARQELYKHLEAIRRQVSQHFLEPNMETRRLSPVEEYFTTLERTIVAQLARVRDQKAAEAQAEIARLAEEAKLGDEQRKVRAGQFQGQIEEWNQLGQGLKSLGARLRELDKSLTPAR
jgi:GTPase SAR1 family protein